MTKRLATFNLSEDTIKKLEDIVMEEILTTGKIVNKSQLVRNMIVQLYNKRFNKPNARQ